MEPASIPGILHAPGQPQFLNPAMMALNVFETDIAVNVLAELSPLVPEVQALETPGTVARLSNGVRLHVESRPKWGSDICWIGNADEPSYRWFEGLFDRLGLAATCAPLLPHDQAPMLYAGYFVTRRRCTNLYMHHDWEPEDNLAFTLMAPLSANAADLGLTYRTVRGEQRDHRYRPGKGLVFGSRFIHSTAVGELAARSVFLCMVFGTDRMERWPEISATAGKQGDFFRQPDGSFIRRAEWLAQRGNSAR